MTLDRHAWWLTAIAWGLGNQLLPGPWRALALLNWVALVPLLARLARPTADRRLWAQVLASHLVMQGLTLGFMASQGWSVWLGVLMLHAALTAVPFWLMPWLVRWRGASCALGCFPLLITFWEWVFSRDALVLPVFLGFSQGDWPELIQHYAVTGVWGGSLVLAASNALATLVWLRCAGRGRQRLWAIAPPAGLILLTASYGHAVLSQAPRDGPGTRLALIQSGHDASESTLMALSDRALHVPMGTAAPDLLLWPESALADRGPAGQALGLTGVARWALARNTPVLLGLTDYTPSTQVIPGVVLDGHRRWNGATLMTPQMAQLWADGERVPPLTYRKRQPFPVGERVPGVEQWPWLGQWVLHKANEPVWNLSRGTQATLFHYLNHDGQVLPVGAFICYEALSPDPPRELAQAGAQWLATLSNDHLFLGTGQLWMMVVHSQIRAVETGRAVARVGTVGHTALIDAHGRLQATLPLLEPGVLTGTVMVHAGQTPFVRWGNWLPPACLALLGLVWCWCSFQERPARSSGWRISDR